MRALAALEVYHLYYIDCLSSPVLLELSSRSTLLNHILRRARLMTCASHKDTDISADKSIINKYFS